MKKFRIMVVTLEPYRKGWDLSRLEFSLNGEFGFVSERAFPTLEEAKTEGRTQVMKYGGVYLEMPGHPLEYAAYNVWRLLKDPTISALLPEQEEYLQKKIKECGRFRPTRVDKRLREIWKQAKKQDKASALNSL